MATIWLLGVSRLRGRLRPHVFYRTIPEASISKAISLIILSLFVIISGTLLLLTSELGPMPHPQTRGKFLEILFEVVSAFGTVGLSTGITGGLSVIGKLVVSMIMFVGRLGPLVIAIAISRTDAPDYIYAEENIMVG